jgi:hypothetical protein
MDQKELSKYFSELGRKGAKERAKRLTPEERTQIAKKAAKASARVRSEKAKKRRS